MTRSRRFYRPTPTKLYRTGPSGCHGMPVGGTVSTYDSLSRACCDSVAATNSEGEKECYWGFDHIAQVADHLGLERPKPGSANEGGWRALL